jgi:aspartate carbamoyltransferase catalytic subunit
VARSDIHALATLGVPEVRVIGPQTIAAVARIERAIESAGERAQFMRDLLRSLGTPQAAVAPKVPA